MGWMGDAHVTAEEAIHNFDMAAFYTNFLRDIRDIQDDKGMITDTVPHVWGNRPADPAWGTAYPLICWHVYQYYGDRRILEEHYEGVKKYVEFLRSREENGLVKYFYYADWVSIDKTPGSIVSSFYYYYDVRVLSDMAKVLGREQDAKLYADLAEKIKSAFHKEYFDPQSKNYANGTQTANTLALFLGIVPESERAAVLANLFDNVVYKNASHLTTGIIGTKYIMELLTSQGNSDLAYDIAAQTTYPSWGYMIENGATTLWELWQLREGPSMNSHNHPMFGSVGSWLYKALAGISLAPDAIGFEKIRIAPQMVRDLRHAAGSVETYRGTVFLIVVEGRRECPARCRRAGRQLGRGRPAPVQFSERGFKRVGPDHLGRSGISDRRARCREGRGKTEKPDHPDRLRTVQLRADRRLTGPLILGSETRQGVPNQPDLFRAPDQSVANTNQPPEAMSKTSLNRASENAPRK